MPRPERLTPADLARWEAAYQSYCRLSCDPTPPRPGALERFCAAEWLGEQLLASGVAPDTASDICFSHGQYAAMGQEPWDAAQSLLARAKVGDYEVPGPTLADRLLREAGVADSFSALIDHLIDQGLTPEEFARHVDAHRAHPRLASQPRPPRFEPMFAALEEHKFAEVTLQRTLVTFRSRWEERQAAARKPGR